MPLNLTLKLSKDSTGKGGASVGVAVYGANLWGVETIGPWVPVKVTFSNQHASTPGVYISNQRSTVQFVFSNKVDGNDFPDYSTRETGPISSTSQLAHFIVGGELRVRATITELDGADLAGVGERADI